MTMTVMLNELERLKEIKAGIKRPNNKNRLNNLTGMCMKNGVRQKTDRDIHREEDKK